MKIVCESCSAKYSIADEKVAGRVFKIRCKKCGAAIVVRGDQVDGGASADAGEASRAPDYGSDAVWHIVVEGEQQGPYAPSQLGEMLSAGTIGWDAFVWREGFDDWKAAQDVEELVQAIMGGSEQQSAGGGDMGADPFAATQHAASAEPDAGMFAAPQADAGADLFAQTDTASPFGASGGDEEDDVVASAPSPRVSADQALTGARNENSVLFSLSNLQALATGPGGGSSSSSSSSSSLGASASASPKPGMAAGEGSGLIDIRALASATGVTPGSSGPITSANNDKVDDLLSIGGAGVGGLGSSLGAPVLIPERKEESNKGIIIAGLAAVAFVAVAAAVIVAVVVTKDDGAETTVAAAGTVSPGETVAAVPGATPAIGAAEQPADTAQAAQPAEAAEPTAQAVGAAPTPASEEAAAPERSERDRDRGSRADRPRSTGGSSSGGGGESRAAAPANDPPARGPRGGRGGGDIDDLLNQALEGGGGGRRQASAPAPRRSGGASSGPQTPSRGDIMSAMNGVQGAVRACGNGAHGNATVRVSFAGNTGRATNAQVNSSLPGPVKSCIAAAVRRARVPPFQQDSFSVNYPFSL